MVCQAGRQAGLSGFALDGRTLIILFDSNLGKGECMQGGARVERQFLSKFQVTCVQPGQWGLLFVFVVFCNVKKVGMYE